MPTLQDGLMYNRDLNEPHAAIADEDLKEDLQIDTIMLMRNF